MGGSASSQAATDGGELKNTDQTNLGPINLTSESSESLNLVEIITCAFVAILVLYLLSWWCQKRNKESYSRLGTLSRVSEFNRTWQGVLCLRVLSACQPTARYLNHHNQSTQTLTNQLWNRSARLSCHVMVYLMLG